MVPEPVTTDQLTVAPLALDDPEGAAAALVRRCIVSGNAETLSIDEAETVLHDADPQAAIELALTCTECGVGFTSVLDAGELLGRELAAHAASFDVSVHALAAHYHWSYADILELPIARRRRFVDLVSEAVAAGAR